MNRFILCVAVSLLSGCSTSRPEGVVLTQLSQVSSSVECPNGGVKVTTGRDWNDDGKLADDEVLQSSQVCNGASAESGASTLTASATLPFGDAHCPTGGARFDFGLDSGGDGGVPRNGVLEDAEIQSTRYVCNGATPVFARSIAAPAGPSPGFSLTASGGSATDAGAGNGGTVTIAIVNGTLGGNVKVFKTGLVDAGFEVPSFVFEPESSALRVTGVVTVKSYDSVLLGSASGDSAFISFGDGVARLIVGRAQASSISVERGATLRLTGLRTDREVILGGDVQNAGTIVVEADAPNTEDSLRLVTRNFYSLEGSSLVARMPLSLIISATKIINRGAVDFHATVDGAAAASLRFKAKELWSTGPFDFRGAASVAASGGAGGGLDVTANVIAIRGEIDCSGGSGRTGGGAAGSVWVEAASALTRLSGRMLIRGGSCSGEGCVAGDGNRVIVYSCGALLVNADIDTSGGDGVEAGGHGGEIALKDLPVSLALAAGSIEVSGNVVSSGGRGRQGGNAGPVTVEVNPVNDALGQEITLFGYESIVANGGNSVTGTGGDGAWIALLNAPSWRGNVEIGPTGAIINEADLHFHGGDGAVGRFGGSVTFGAFARSTEVGSFLSDGESIHNSGALDGVGGTGTAQSGGGGSVGFASPGDIENLGTIALSGGGTMQRCEVGGPGGGLGLSSPGGSVTSTGAIHVEGGAGRRSAGNGGGAAFFGVFASNAATITAGGGESLERGGAGGEVSFWSTGVQQAVIGLVDSRGGAGATPGQTGRVEINGSILNR